MVNYEISVIFKLGTGFKDVKKFGVLNYGPIGLVSGGNFFIKIRAMKRLKRWSLERVEGFT